MENCVFKIILVNGDFFTRCGKSRDPIHDRYFERLLESFNFFRIKLYPHKLNYSIQCRIPVFSFLV